MFAYIYLRQLKRLLYGPLLLLILQEKYRKMAYLNLFYQ